MIRRNRTKFTFPVGYRKFHKDQVFNFQFNRWHSLGYARYEDMKEAGQKINNFAEWKIEMLSLAERAVSEKRMMNAAIYYRGAEFYITSEDPDKELLYDRFVDLFYKIFKHDGIKRFKVPYQNTYLPAMRVNPTSSKKKGTIVMHGGFDSWIEEFYPMMRAFSDNGYDVIAFEGPGQGGARKKYGLAWTHEWEKPTSAVLDYFKLDNVTLYGISMGGYLCLRAAAFESRISRVIASGHAVDYAKIPPLPFQWLMKFFMNFENFMNNQAAKKMKKDPMHNWSLNNAMYITKTKTPMEAMEVMLQMTAENQHSDLIKQDVLILTGRNDHFIPFKMHKMQIKILTNAKSVTGRVFTKDEQAHNHCQIGNIGLALDVMLDWISKKS